MSSQELPSADSPDVYLVDANLQEIKQTWDYNAAEWRGPLSLEAYMRREQHLLEQDLAKENGLTSWILVHQPKSDQPRRILCACETIRKRAFVSVEGKTEEVTCHGVCSVFCPAEHRGKGYAGKMISELAKKIKHWQSEERPVSFSVLYSDIGKKFYADRGWKVFESAHISLPPSKSVERAGTTLLLAADIPPLCEEDERQVHSQVSALSSKSIVAIAPDYRTIEWHHARAEFFAKELLNKDVTYKGAIARSEGRRAWCYWQHNWSKVEANKDNKLYILRIHADENDVDLLEALLAAAQAEAAAWNLDHVELWNPSPATVAAAQRLEPAAAVVERESSSITSLLWFDDADGKDIRWLCNERYAWC